MKSDDFLGNCLFYCRAIAEDAKTPGPVAKERLVRNAELLKTSCECWCQSCGYDAKALEAKAVQANQKAEALLRVQANALKRVQASR